MPSFAVAAACGGEQNGLNQLISFLCFNTGIIFPSGGQDHLDLEPAIFRCESGRSAVFLRGGLDAASAEAMIPLIPLGGFGQAIGKLQRTGVIIAHRDHHKAFLISDIDFDPPGARFGHL